MTKGNLRAVVCTSTLDLGIDWGAVDNVICIGAPKAQRDLCNASAAPTTALTIPAAQCSCRPTASRCWNAKPRVTR